MSGGEATFEIVSKPKTGPVYLQVSAEGLVGAVDSFYTIAGEAASIGIVVDRTPLLANGVSSREVTLQLLDANGNLRVNPDGSPQLFDNPLNPFTEDALPVVTTAALPQRSCSRSQAQTQPACKAPRP